MFNSSTLKILTRLKSQYLPATIFPMVVCLMWGKLSGVPLIISRGRERVMSDLVIKCDGCGWCDTDRTYFYADKEGMYCSLCTIVNAMGGEIIEA